MATSPTPFTACTMNRTSSEDMPLDKVKDPVHSVESVVLWIRSIDCHEFGVPLWVTQTCWMPAAGSPVTRACTVTVEPVALACTPLMLGAAELAAAPT